MLDRELEKLVDQGQCGGLDESNPKTERDGFIRNYQMLMQEDKKLQKAKEAKGMAP